MSYAMCSPGIRYCLARCPVLSLLTVLCNTRYWRRVPSYAMTEYRPMRCSELEHGMMALSYGMSGTEVGAESAEEEEEEEEEEGRGMGGKERAS
eukprot:1456471-Rhodomonas_salina.1